MIDPARLDLTDRTALMRSLPPGLKIAEIGVLSGEFATVIRSCGPAELWLIDCWVAPPGYQVDAATLAQINLDYLRAYLGVLRTFASHQEVRVLRAFSEEAAPLFPEGYFDLVYIDADHLRCGSDINAWWSAVKTGGLLTGHDYEDPPNAANCVKQDVDTFVAQTGHRLWLTREPLASWIIPKL